VRAAARRGASRERLSADGFSDDEIARIFEHVPVATHNQRGLGTLQIGCPEDDDTDIDAQTLLAIVEDSMSSEIYELMKRSDEGAVVEKAHRRPALRRGLRARDDPRRASTLPELGRRHVRLRPPGEPRDDPPAQRSPRSATAGWASCATSSPRARTQRTHVTMRDWLDGGG
jgi:hypothetical protein